MLLYALGLGSPIYALPTDSYLERGPPAISGRRFTATSCSTAARSSFISTRTSGSISAGSRMPLRETRASTIARTAAARLTSSRNTRSGILLDSLDTAATSGDRQRATAPAGLRGRFGGLNGRSLTTSHEARRMAPTTGPSRRGRWSHRSPSHPRSCYRRFGIFRSIHRSRASIACGAASI